MIDVVLLDLDGTLTDSAAGIMASYRHALGQLGISAPDAAIRRCIGPPLVDGFTALGVPPDRLGAAVGLYREYFSVDGIMDNRLYPGIEEMLISLSGASRRLALATSKLTEFGTRILGLFGLESLFEVVSGSTPDGSRLQKEEIVEQALHELGRPDPSTVVMVGDREHDVLAGRHHGLGTVGVTWGYGSVAELRGAGPEHLVTTPEELVDLILGGAR